MPRQTGGRRGRWTSGGTGCTSESFVVQVVVAWWGGRGGVNLRVYLPHPRQCGARCRVRALWRQSVSSPPSSSRCRSTLACQTHCPPHRCCASPPDDSPRAQADAWESDMARLCLWPECVSAAAVAAGAALARADVAAVVASVAVAAISCHRSSCSSRSLLCCCQRMRRKKRRRRRTRRMMENVARVLSVRPPRRRQSSSRALAT